MSIFLKERAIIINGEKNVGFLHIGRSDPFLSERQHDNVLITIE